MKSIFIFLMTTLMLNDICKAQSVAINNSAAIPHASAMLDVNSPSKGMLIPRIALTSLSDAVSIPNPATSLLLYNTNSALAGGAGFYYNSGTMASPTWTKLASSSDVLWRQQTDYVELVPNKPLFLQTNVGLGTATPLEKLHVANGNIKVGNPLWSAGNDRMLKFGDGDYVQLGEAGEDDAMQLFSKYFWFRNSGSYTGNVGIGTLAAPTARLEVNGSFKLTNGSQGNGKVLTSDAVGNASWAAPVTNTNFRAISSALQSYAANTLGTFNGFIDDYDVNNDFYGGAFHAPVQGIYHFDAKVEIGINVANLPGYLRVYLRLYKNGVMLEENVHHVANNTATTYFQTITMNESVQLLAGDQVSLRVYSDANPGTAGYSANKVVFSGFRNY